MKLLLLGCGTAMLLLSGCSSPSSPASASIPESKAAVCLLPASPAHQALLDTLKKDQLVQWDSAGSGKFNSIAFTTPLTFPRTLEKGNLGTIAIRAFEQDFGGGEYLDPVWVLGYVAPQDLAHPSLPGPLVVAQVGQPTRIRWENQLAQTLQHNPRYHFPGHWYPLVYEMKPGQQNMPNPMLSKMLYPEDVSRPAVMNAEMASYYATTVHLHGANLAWRYDGYPTSHYFAVNNRVGSPQQAAKNAISWGLFGPFEKQQRVEYVYPNVFPEGDPAMLNPLARASLLNTVTGKHGGILWYHDHAMMRTAPNVYLGLAGPYLVRGVEEDAIPAALRNYKQSVLVICDKSFSQRHVAAPVAKGGKPRAQRETHLYYDVTQHGPTPADTQGQPEFYGNSIVVNGKLWPKLIVERRPYRFRLINTSSSRFYRLSLRNGLVPGRKKAEVEVTADSTVFRQIGTEAGVMPPLGDATAPLPFPCITRAHPLTLAPGERADVFIDFTRITGKMAGVMLVNSAVDGPYQADKDTLLTMPTNYVMAFAPGKGWPATLPPSPNTLTPKLKQWVDSRSYLQATSNLRQQRKPAPASLSRNALFANSSLPPAVQDLLKRVPTTYWKDGQVPNSVFRLLLKEAADSSELPPSYKAFLARECGKDKKCRADALLNLSYPMVLMNEGDWNSEAEDTSSMVGRAQAIKQVANLQQEVWEIENTTDDAHPIHLHLNRFQILGRIPIADNSRPETELRNERGWKDVVQAKPHYKTYLLVQYILHPAEPREGQFVYHCHILEHEDMSMMRRLVVTRTPTLAVAAALPLRAPALRHRPQVSPTLAKHKQRLPAPGMKTAFH